VNMTIPWTMSQSITNMIFNQIDKKSINMNPRRRITPSSLMRGVVGSLACLAERTSPLRLFGPISIFLLLEGPLSLSGCPGQRHGGRGRGRGPGALHHHCGGSGGREAGGEVGAVSRVLRRPVSSLGKVHPPPRNHTGGTPCPPPSGVGTLLLVETRRAQNIKISCKLLPPRAVNPFQFCLAGHRHQSQDVSGSARFKGGSKEKRSPPPSICML